MSTKASGNKRTMYASFVVILILLAGNLLFYAILQKDQRQTNPVSQTDNTSSAFIALTVSESEAEIGKALSCQLHATGGETITFRSSDEAVATVDETGKITGVSVGKCTVTAENECGSSADCTVTVKKVCYLTIDDGPTDCTESILAVLKEYDVPATFFVVSSPKLYLTKKMEEQGCVVGLHSFSHIFRQCYSKEYTYFYGLEDLADIVEKYTGKRPDMIRFPGGTSNTRCEPIWMTRMLKGAYDKGYRVFDWTAAAGDTSGKASADYSIKNVKKSCTEDEEIVLMHDREFNVESLRTILPYLRKKGYLFATLDQYPHGSYAFEPLYSRTHPDLPSTSVRINAKTLSLKPGESEMLFARMAPEQSTDYLRWESSDTDVVTVRASGRVIAVKKGKADVSAITSSGHKSVCHVTVG